MVSLLALQARSRTCRRFARNHFVKRRTRACQSCPHRYCCWHSGVISTDGAESTSRLKYWSTTTRHKKWSGRIFCRTIFFCFTALTNAYSSRELPGVSRCLHYRGSGIAVIRVFVIGSDVTRCRRRFFVIGITNAREHQVHVVVELHVLQNYSSVRADNGEPVNPYGEVGVSHQSLNYVTKNGIATVLESFEFTGNGDFSRGRRTQRLEGYLIRILLVHAMR